MGDKEKQKAEKLARKEAEAAKAKQDAEIDSRTRSGANFKTENEALLEEFRKLNLKIDSNNQELTASINNLQITLTALVAQSEERMTEKMEKQANELRSQFDLEIGHIRASLSLAETNLNKRIKRTEFDPDVSIVVFGLPFAEGENVVLRVEALIESLECDPVPRIVAAQRLAPRDQKPGLIKVELASTDDKIAVLRRKKALKDIATYSTVYINTAKSHTERLLDLNLKTLLEEIPSGKDFFFTSNGRLVRKKRSDTQPGAHGAHGVTHHPN